MKAVNVERRCNGQGCPLQPFEVENFIDVDDHRRSWIVGNERPPDLGVFKRRRIFRGRAVAEIIFASQPVGQIETGKSARLMERAQSRYQPVMVEDSVWLLCKAGL